MEESTNKKQTLSTSSHEIEKIPDFILLKESRKEVAKLEEEISKLYKMLEKRDSQIDYLNGVVNREIPNETKKLSNEVKREVKKEQVYVKMMKNVDKTLHNIRRLREANEQLLSENIQLRIKLGL